MKKSIKLDKNKAVDLYNSSKDKGFKEMLEETFGKEFAKPKNITDEVYDLTSLSLFIGENPLIYPKPKNQFEKYINACSVLAKVAEVYNESTVLDWTNTSIYKWCPYKYYSITAGGGFGVDRAGGWSYGLLCSACLFYKSKELSEASYDNFTEYWEDYWSLEK